MLYNDFQDLKISAFGFGVMRLPTADGNYLSSCINEDEAIQMIAESMEAGVNYYDTGFDYHDGNSEVVLRKALAPYPRESYYLADKFPGYNTKYFGHVEEIFEEQLERLGVEYFDFYMLHNICESNIEFYFEEEKYGTIGYLLEQKAAGRIRHFGISTHASLETLQRIFDRWGDIIEFCQLQVNWIDWEFQQAREKMELCRSLGIPVIVMEPLRGGKLARPNEADAARLEQLRPGMRPVEWAFDFLQGLDNIVTVLSGVSNIEQTREDLQIFSRSNLLSDAELAGLADLAAEMTSRGSIPCTACKYCTSYCPMDLDIPGLIEMWNEHRFTGPRGFIAPMLLTSLPEEKRPDACIACHSCESVCPQNIAIADVLAEFAENVKPS